MTCKALPARSPSNWISEPECARGDRSVKAIGKVDVTDRCLRSQFVVIPLDWPPGFASIPMHVAACATGAGHVQAPVGPAKGKLGDRIVRQAIMRYKKQIWILVLPAMLLGVAVYFTLFHGTTQGPDFLAALQGGGLQLKDVRSVEVIEPPVGHMPFSQAEYDALTRIGTLDDQSRIVAFLNTVGRSVSSGSVQQNHPVQTYNVYCKVNVVDSGFYYLYVSVEKDNDGEVCYAESNARNATNPNGARLYRLHDYGVLLTLLKKHIER